MIAWIEGFAIFLAVFIVVIVGSYNDYKKEDQFFKLYALDQEGKYVSDSLINCPLNAKLDLNLEIQCTFSISNVQVPESFK